MKRSENAYIRQVNLEGHMTLAMPFFSIFVSGRVQSVPVNMHIKLEFHTFNHIGVISI